jgi:hypothetical protein
MSTPGRKFFTTRTREPGFRAGKESVIFGDKEMGKMFLEVDSSCLFR